MSQSKMRTGLLGPSAMGQTNRARVLELLHQNGPSSRADLARALGVNRATIATIVQPLVEDATLVEGDSVAASPLGGKPARPLWFNHDGLQLGAMRIGPGSVTTARMAIDGTVHRSSRADFDPAGSSAAIEKIILRVAARCFGQHQMLGIGVAISGMVDTTEGTVISLHLAPGLNGYPVGPVLQRRFGVPVTVDHHPRVQALGDKWFGAGRGASSFASVYTGEALGIGIVHGGTIMRGLHGAGGEYGHTVVDLNGRHCLCGRTGCWETIATLGWLRREAETAGLPQAGDIDTRKLTELSDAGDRSARTLLGRYAANLAVGMANNEQALGSGLYIMHGDVCGGGEPMRSLVEEQLIAAAPRRDPLPQIVLAGQGDEMALLGGGGLVLSTTLTGAS